MHTCTYMYIHGRAVLILQCFRMIILGLTAALFLRCSGSFIYHTIRQSSLGKQQKKKKNVTCNPSIPLNRHTKPFEVKPLISVQRFVNKQPFFSNVGDQISTLLTFFLSVKFFLTIRSIFSCAVKFK